MTMMKMIMCCARINNNKNIFSSFFVIIISKRERGINSFSYRSKLICNIIRDSVHKTKPEKPKKKQAKIQIMRIDVVVI